MASNSSQDTAQEVQNARVGSLSIHLFGLSAQVHRLPPTGVLAVEGLALDQPVDSHAITPATTAWARVFTELARALDDALEPNSMVLGLTSKAQLDIIKVGCSPQEEQIAQEAIKEVATEWVRNAGRLLQVRRTKRSDRPNRRIYPGDTLADAGKMMLYHELVHMCRHQRAARSGEDSEGVHQMRIGSRKVRAAIRSFRAAYVPEVETALLTELKQLGRKLGRVRDADVLGLRLGGYAERVDAVDDPAHAALQALLKRERGPHRGTLVRVLKGVPYADWLAEIG
ncbi:MAG: CHAD domain-containing protein, partial [Candidatus Latescibacteria bacterium]|nr:CHAD domain-containing protein [Candidatus Latescibacterota bacterium]